MSNFDGDDAVWAYAAILQRRHVLWPRAEAPRASFTHHSTLAAPFYVLPPSCACPAALRSWAHATAASTALLIAHSLKTVVEPAYFRNAGSGPPQLQPSSLVTIEPFVPGLIGAARFREAARGCRFPAAHWSPSKQPTPDMPTPRRAPPPGAQHALTAGARGGAAVLRWWQRQSD